MINIESKPKSQFHKFGNESNVRISTNVISSFDSPKIDSDYVKTIMTDVYFREKTQFFSKLLLRSIYPIYFSNTYV
ncbi:hypothetical protein AKJ66_00215 [candidate division MSBL1 archaeon SCGC-AAA259E22]|uniref:Uncharacterized protein n=1 Tax=candidate division MSBL1 archaeon SCGC-AAA259E22 TaxID=1698265 RepID=A0A133UID2_9EURY|nr:hypothetical protein AKJ66_00215 [candidate division MSBL1 archaeon SCGC-AAA259E22]